MSGVFELLKNAAAREQLGHGLLLVSPSTEAPSFVEGLRDLVSSLMCLNRTGRSTACGECDSCRAYKDSTVHEGMHPDLFWIKPEARSGYSVDQIKNLRTSLGLARSIGAERVIVIESAEELGGSGGASANALLKLLEEPRPKTRLLLLSSRPEGILPTIRSRCQIFRIPLKGNETSSSQLGADALQNWSALWTWIDRGFQGAEWALLTLPPDEDTYFKEREIATEELKNVFWESWGRARNVIPGLSLTQAHESLQWFENFEILLASFRSNGQGALQWSAFKSRARLG